MASIEDVVDGMAALLGPLFTGLNFPVLTGSDWPGAAAINTATKNDKKVLVSVADRGIAGPGTTMPRELGEETIATGIKATLSRRVLNHNETATLAVELADDSEAVKVDDGIGLTFTLGTLQYGATCRAVEGDDVSTLATKLMENIQTNQALSDLLSVTAVENVLTLTAIDDGAKLIVRTGNIGWRYREVARLTSELQIVIWAPTVKHRKEVGSLVEPFLFSFRDSELNGYELPSGEIVHVIGTKAIPVSDKDTPADIYRRDFILQVNYGSVTREKVYPVLVGIVLPFSDL